MLFGELDINPAKNPAILATATWDPEKAWEIVRLQDKSYWSSLQDAIVQSISIPITGNLIAYPGSCAHRHGSVYFLAGLEDGQQVFIRIGPDENESALGVPVAAMTDQAGTNVTMYQSDADTIARFFQHIRADKGPKAMGNVPRLGIGTRMTTAVWPAIYRAMSTCDFAANAIQNSMRELYLLDDLLAGKPGEKNYGPNLGTIESGHTGSTFEGLWVYGVLEALKSDTCPMYGADADHVQVKRGDGTVLRAKQVLDAARLYTFYTLDVSDLLDNSAVATSPAAAEEYLVGKVGRTDHRRLLLSYHRERGRQIESDYRLDDAALGRLVGKYWDALGVIEELSNHVRHIKNGQPFDLEIAIDEVPAGLRACDCITTNEELMFILLEAQRREIPVTHIAANTGIEKEVDYRCPDGRTGLEKRVRSQARIAEELNVMLDFHSGDDLSATTRRVIGHATQGRNHFKVSPRLQVLFAEVLGDFHPDIFRAWWDATLAYARQEAAQGATLAVEGIKQYEQGGNRQPSPYHPVFHHYGFAHIGRRDAQGQFLHRERFYSLSPEFYQAYQDRIVGYLSDLAEDLFNCTADSGESPS